MRATGLSLDGRWLAVALLLAYYAVLGLTGPAGALIERWHRAGVYALPLPFADLQVFPAARATVASGGELYGASAADPLKRPYNYPRVWLAFMRFPASDVWIRGVGFALAVGAISALLLFWGRLSAGEGLFGGALLCSPAFQLGVERGNTDLAILALLIGGVSLAGEGKRGRLATAIWWLAAILKLYPVVALGSGFEGSLRGWLRRTWLPLALFAAYLVLSWRDLMPILRNTGGGWVQSYGSEMLAWTAGQVKSYYGLDLTGGFQISGWGRLLAAGGVGGILVRSWLGRPAMPAQDQALPPAARRARIGFRIGALVFVATFIVGTSFDYRQCFLLLTLPQLFAWQREGGRSAAIALTALLFSLGTNYLLAGWPGFVLKEIAGWVLLFVLAALLGSTWCRVGQSRS